MSLSWHKRKTRLSSLISAEGGEDAEGTVLDQLMHGQTVIGKTGEHELRSRSHSNSHVSHEAKTTEIDTLRFGDKDLDLVGTLEYGQYGVVSETCFIRGVIYLCFTD